jgi:hypothetical protein
VNILEYAQNRECQDISGVEGEGGYTVLVGLPEVEA